MHPGYLMIAGLIAWGIARFFEIRAALASKPKVGDEGSKGEAASDSNH